MNSAMRVMVQAAAVAALALLLPSAGLGAMEIYLAPISYQDESGAEAAGARQPAADLLRLFAETEIADGVSVRDASESTDQAPRTWMEAARLCESQGYAYLLYGFVKRTDYSYYAELKLLEREGKDVAAAFITGDDASHYERLIEDLARKIISYVRTDLGMAPAPSPQEPARNLISLPIAAGWWTPMGGQWSAAMAGLVTAHTSVRFIPARPLFQLLRRPGFLALGLDLEYALGTSQPGVESFYLHAAKVRLPVEAFLDLGAGHLVGLGVGPLLEVDTLAKAKLYGSTVISTTVVPGAAFSVIYQYILNPTVTLGLANTFDVALYSRPLFTWSPGIGVVIWLGGANP
jgi:hypothetical protein